MLSIFSWTNDVKNLPPVDDGMASDGVAGSNESSKSFVQVGNLLRIFLADRDITGDVGVCIPISR